MIKPKFFGIVKNGKLIFPDRGFDMRLNHIRTLEGKEIEETISVRRKSRSLQQNAYYWGVVIRVIADDLGYHDDDIHYELRRKFLSQPDDAMGIPRSTTDLSTKEFNEYIENIKMWAAQDLNIVIPDPHEVDL